jgi:hypothetical protein
MKGRVLVSRASKGDKGVRRVYLVDEAGRQLAWLGTVERKTWKGSRQPGTRPTTRGWLAVTATGKELRPEKSFRPYTAEAMESAAEALRQAILDAPP